MRTKKRKRKQQKHHHQHHHHHQQQQQQQQQLQTNPNINEISIWINGRNIETSFKDTFLILNLHLFFPHSISLTESP